MREFYPAECKIYCIFFGSILNSRENRRDRRKKAQSTISASMDIFPFHPKNFKQKELWGKLNDSSIFVNLACGAAGTGKTLVGLSYGIQKLSNKEIDRLIYVRSDVGIMENQRGRGAIPGDLLEKSGMLLYPILDNMKFTCPNPRNTLEYLIRVGKFEIVLLEDIRGRSLSDSFVLVDEAQNFTIDQTKTVISRVGKNSTVMLCGDPSQADTASLKTSNGLIDAKSRLSGLKSVALTEFSFEDIVRNSLLKDILMRYN